MIYKCPKCGWVAHCDSKWTCDCGHQWNTFETHGQCPECKKNWAETQCQQCNEWSDHNQWYKP